VGDLPGLVVSIYCEAQRVEQRGPAVVTDVSLTGTKQI
jgi:hypothetical protein